MVLIVIRYRISCIINHADSHSRTVEAQLLSSSLISLPLEVYFIDVMSQLYDFQEAFCIGFGFGSVSIGFSASHAYAHTGVPPPGVFFISIFLTFLLFFLPRSSVSRLICPSGRMPKSPNRSNPLISHVSLDCGVVGVDHRDQGDQGSLIASNHHLRVLIMHQSHQIRFIFIYESSNSNSNAENLLPWSLSPFPFRSFPFASFRVP